MLINIEGKLHAFYFNQERQQVQLLMQDRSRHTLYILAGLIGHDELIDSIGLTQPGDEVEIVTTSPDMGDSYIKSWHNLSLTRWLSGRDGEGNVAVPV